MERWCQEGYEPIVRDHKLGTNGRYNRNTGGRSLKRPGLGLDWSDILIVLAIVILTYDLNIATSSNPFSHGIRGPIARFKT